MSTPHPRADVGQFNTGGRRLGETSGLDSGARWFPGCRGARHPRDQQRLPTDRDAELRMAHQAPRTSTSGARVVAQPRCPEGATGGGEGNPSDDEVWEAARTRLTKNNKAEPEETQRGVWTGVGAQRRAAPGRTHTDRPLQRTDH